MTNPPPENIEYAGFWIRLFASIIDSILIALITYPLLFAIYGWAGADYSSALNSSGFVATLFLWVLPVVAAIWFWTKKQATPGKMLFSLKVLDAKTGNNLTLGQSIARYAGYIIAGIPLGLGYIWAAFDSKKQGWHDKIAGTVVVRSKQRGTETVRFPQG